MAAVAAAGLTVGPLLIVIIHADWSARLREADLAAVWFTLWQATLSTLLSVALAVPVARALARRKFPGRKLIITLLGAPFLLPVVVATMGIIAVFGRAGLVNRALESAGLPPIQIYGPGGVILAHVFFNLPLAVRLILQGWTAIPAERFRLAASLGLGTREIGRMLERPMLREVVPGTALAIFLVCLTSFAVALTLGGGPRATTLELAIFQAFRFDFDLGRAALLGAVQVAICAVLTMVALRLATPSALGAGLDRPVERWDARHGWRRPLDIGLIAATTVFLMVPILAVILSGVPGLADLPGVIWSAALRSVLMAVMSAALCISLSLMLAVGAAKVSQRSSRMLESLGMMALAASPLVVGTGLFLALRGMADPARLALPVTVIVNALMALPFALRALIPAARATEADFGRLGDSLGLSGLARMRLLTLPRLRAPLGFAAGLAAALAMGDLGVIALFADPERATLPLALYQLMGAYRMEAAAGAAILLMVLSFGMFWVSDRWGRHAAA